MKGFRAVKLMKDRRLATASLVIVGLGMTTAAISAPEGHRAAAAAAAVMPEAVASVPDTGAASSLESRVTAVVQALQQYVKESSSPEALPSAVRSYLAYQQARPEDVKKPYLYFVDFGLPGSTPRGYVFDMAQLSVVDGPFTVAHGRGSASSGNARNASVENGMRLNPYTVTSACARTRTAHWRTAAGGRNPITSGLA